MKTKPTESEARASRIPALLNELEENAAIYHEWNRFTYLFREAAATIRLLHQPPPKKAKR